MSRIRPSSLPMLAQCSAWESTSDDSRFEYTGLGTQRHKALEELLESGGDNTDTFDLLSDEEDRDGVEWAHDYIKLKASDEYRIQTERLQSLVDEDFNQVFRGTLDVTCGRDLFDFKWRERDYSLQLTAYALMMFQADGWDEVRVHVLYGATKTARTFTVTR